VPVMPIVSAAGLAKAKAFSRQENLFELQAARYADWQHRVCYLISGMPSLQRPCRRHAPSRLSAATARWRARSIRRQQSRFQQMSDTIITRVDEMGSRLDELEKSIADLMEAVSVVVSLSVLSFAESQSDTAEMC
jgi:Heat shock factor binding protein 1